MKKFYSLFLTILSASAFAANHNVSVTMSFTPSTLTIDQGDTVTWTQMSGTHNVNGSQSTFPGNPASFGSGAAAGGTWTYSYVFSNPGTYTYQCDPHASFMIGTITVNSGPCSDLFFSEYGEGSSNHKYIEIYNPTSSAISLAGYTVYLSGNGGSYTNTFTSNASIASGDVYVVSTNQADSIIQAAADTILSYPSIVHFNGDDALILFDGTDTIDVIGVPGVDPGSSWPVGSGSTANHTLVRMASITGGTTDWTTGALEWDVYPQNTWTYIGSHSSSCLSGGGGPLPGACSDLFFSEYGEGSSNHKYIEIYNPTSNAISLNGYTVYLSGNGGSYTNTFTSNASIASGDVYIVCTNQADPSIQSTADTILSYPSIVHFNGDDALILFDGTDTIDVLGTPGIDPGSSWTVGTGSTQNHTLVRKSTVTEGSTDWTVGSTEWDVYAQNTWTYIGSHSSSCTSGGGGGGGGVTGPGATNIAPWKSVDANGVADSLNKSATIHGTIFSIDFDGNAGYSFYVHDGTGGINIYKSSDVGSYTAPQKGDSLRIVGQIAQYNGLIEIIPDSVILLAQSANTVSETIVTTIGESEESELIRLNNMTLATPSQWSNSGSGFNVDITDGNSTFTMRVDADCNLYGTNPPTGLFDVVGVGSQFDFSNPYTSGYQVFPRDTTAASPSIRFASSSLQVLEGNVTTSIDLIIQPTLSSSSTITLSNSPGTGFVVGTDASFNPSISQTGTTLSIPANTDTVSIIATIIDDSNIEGPEFIDFIITNATGVSIGSIDSMRFTILDNDINIPTYSIPQVKGQNSDGVSDSLGVYCKVEGTVIGVNMQSASSGNVAFTIHDGSVGFGVFSPSSSSHGYTVTEGDVVRVIGTIGQFNGLAQVGADSIAVISTGASIPAPTTIIALDETTESNLIRMNNVVVVDPTQWTNAGSGFNVDVSDGMNTIALRIDADVTLYNEPCPVGVFDIIGIGGQFDMSSPFTSGYQMLPRQKEDVLFPTPTTYDLAITEIMSGSNDPNTNLSEDWFEIKNYGSTSVDLSGFSWDDNSFNPGASVFMSNTVIQPGESMVVWGGLTTYEGLFRGNWGLSSPIQVICSDELVNSSFPGLSSSSDAVVLFDTSSTPVEICRAEYTSTAAGYSVEFDTNCVYLGNASGGVRGAYSSAGGDIGSPGDEAFPFNLTDQEMDEVQIYPNPASTIATLQMPEAGNKTIRIINAIGQKIYEHETQDIVHSINTEILHDGIYLIQVKTLLSDKSLKLIVKH
jgi:plastocyanin/DNA/RNA endonuclease YhcR with UshA esterase domain